MLNPNDIFNKSKLPPSKQHQLEQSLQKDELSYFASEAFEKHAVTNSEIEQLNSLIDKKAGVKKNNSFNTVFISLLCGLLIGVSIFFVVFHKNQNHPSVFQFFGNDEPASQRLNNNISPNDTLFPNTTISQEPKVIEHFNSVTENIEQTSVQEMPDMLIIKPETLLVDDGELEQELKMQFIPNAPVVFISGLKVTNYRMYYFKHEESINLMVNEGLEAQYENNTAINKPETMGLNNYLAHKIIRRAMQLFNAKKYSNCIEELTLLYNYNTDDANAQFYLGMSFYNLGKYTLAKNYFQKNLDNQNNIFHQESEFYLAMSLLNNNEEENAIKLLQTISSNNGFYSLRAKEVLAKRKL